MYAAANKVFRSPDRGLSWVAISPDLTGGAKRDEIVTMGVKNSDIRISRNDGIAAWPTIVALAESPKRAGLLYAGTDDGHLSVSRDAGRTWTNVFEKVSGLPQDTFVSRVVPSRFDEGTVYATFDGHRQNDFETYVYASNDYGQTWRSIASTLKAEVARTLTEDLKNPDLLYLGTETGLFVSIDRARSWMRLEANLPMVRIDEITLHPRDNAMLLATHGRGIWILDHLEPIQEYAAAQAATADARFFTPPPLAVYRRPARDRNYEFWGDQTFYGENPPQAAVLSWHLKREAGEVKLRITDATGKEVREISGQVLAKSNKPGIQAACWDLRVQPGPAAPTGGGRGGAQGGEAGGRAGGPGGGQAAGPGGPGGGPGGAATSPFGAGCGSPGGGFGGGGGGFGAGAGNAGPFVLPGIYNVSLIVDGKTVDMKPLRVAADPEVALTEAERRRMFDMAMEMHELQKRGTEVSNGLRSLNTRMAELTKEIGGPSDIPADVKASFEALNKELATLTPRFAAPAGGRGGGPPASSGPSAGPGQVNVLARVGQAKNGLMAGMSPTEQTLRAYTESKIEMPKAIGEANALFIKAAALGKTLANYKLTLTAPEPVSVQAPQLAKSKGRQPTKK